jgi:DnaK suppressor protein
MQWKDRMARNELDLKRIRQRLLELRQSLRDVRDTGDEAAATVELDQTRLGRLSRMDALQAQAISVETNRRREHQARQVDAALARLDRNEFGGCLVCGEAIDPRRLEHDPATSLCIACAEQAERQ